MADEYEDGGGGSKKLPTWVFIAGGGGLLLLLLTNKGSKSTTATDNLLMAEIDATLKSLQERMEADQKSYQEEQRQAWDDFKLSLGDMLGEGKYADPPYSPQPPRDRTYPGSRDDYRGTEPGGSGSKNNIPAGIDSAVFDNYIFGFNYRKAKR